MSGNAESAPFVDLVGDAMERLVYAIPVIAAVAPRPLVLVGGLAVICRLGHPYRSTGDVDTVDRRRDEELSALELLRASGADESGTTGALVQTSSGPVQVDILDITDVALDNLPDEPNDRLYYLAHNWATATATPMILRTSGSSPVTVRVAQPGPLIAMKLHSLMNRLASKEASDLLDIVRLTLDPVTGVVARQQLSAASPQLRADALLHVRLSFVTNAARSLSRIRTISEGKSATRDEIDLVAELLTESLSP